MTYFANPSFRPASGLLSWVAVGALLAGCTGSVSGTPQTDSTSNSSATGTGASGDATGAGAVAGTAAADGTAPGVTGTDVTTGAATTGTVDSTATAVAGTDGSATAADAAMTGSGGAAAVSTGVVIPAAAAASETLGLARLSRTQWGNTIRDLLPLAGLEEIETELTPDAVLSFDNESAGLFISETLRTDIERVSEELAASLVADSTALAALIPAGAPADDAGRATAYIESFGAKAYRRPLTDAEVAQYQGLFNAAPELFPELDAFTAGLQLTLQLFLQSPYFLYRSEFGVDPAAPQSRLTSYEVASKLSYALTNTMPDALLFAAAAAGTLDTPAGVEAEARRLLAMPEGLETVSHFNFQVFRIGIYDTIEKDRSVSPEFTDNTGLLLREEALSFLGYVFQNQGGLRDVFTSTTTFVNAELAQFYGISGNFGEQLMQVELDPTERAGFLTRLGFLASMADDQLQDTIHRGVYINERILCNALSAPVANVPPLPVQDGTLTNRQNVDAFTGEGTCGAACHATFINPAGFAFENFDGLGRFREVENGQPVDASGSYPFADGARTFGNAVEFSQILAEVPQAHSCFAKHWLSYLFARTPTAADDVLAANVAQRSFAENLSIENMILSFVADESFLTRVKGGAL